MIDTLLTSYLVETVSDEGEDQNTSEGRQEPHPPGYPRLSRLTGNNCCGNNVGLEVNQEFNFKITQRTPCLPGTPNVFHQLRTEV